MMALRTRPCCWAQLAGVLGGEKTNLGSITIINISPALSLAIGGRDGMDWGGEHWMTCSNYRHVINHGSACASSLLRAFGGVFGVEKNVIMVYYHNKKLFRPFRDL